MVYSTLWKPSLAIEAPCRMSVLQVSIKVVAVGVSVGLGMKACEGLTPQAVLGGMFAGLLVATPLLLQHLKVEMQAFLQDQFKENNEILQDFLKVFAKGLVKDNMQDVKAFICQQLKVDMQLFFQDLFKVNMLDIQEFTDGRLKATMGAGQAFLELKLKDSMEDMQGFLKVLAKGIYDKNMKELQEFFLQQMKFSKDGWLWNIYDRCDKGASKLEVMEYRMEALTYNLKDCSRPWGLLIFIAGPRGAGPP